MTWFVGAHGVNVASALQRVVRALKRELRRRHGSHNAFNRAFLQTSVQHGTKYFGPPSSTHPFIYLFIYLFYNKCT